MTDQERAVMKQALEALAVVLNDDYNLPYSEIVAATEALRAALAEPQEPDVPEVCFGNIPPVGWLESPHGEFRKNLLYKLEFPSQLLSWQIPLYAHLRAALAQPEPAAPLKRGTTGICTRVVCECEQNRLGPECVYLRPRMPTQGQLSALEALTADAEALGLYEAAPTAVEEGK